MTGNYEKDRKPTPLTDRLFPPNPRVDFVAPPEIPFALFEYQSRALKELYEITGIEEIDMSQALKIIGVDMASGPDQCGQALAVASGKHVVLITGERTSVDREWINGLNANRKADRECLAMALTMLAEARGAKVERMDTPATAEFGGQGIDLRISNMGVGCMVYIDNIDGGTRTLISWYNSEYTARNFTTRFCVCVGSSNDHRPHHKATSLPADWYSLAMYLDGGLLLASRGSAFDS